MEVGRPKSGDFIYFTNPHFQIFKLAHIQLCLFEPLHLCIFELKSYAVMELRCYDKKTAYCNCQLNTPVFGLRTSDFFFTFTTLPLCTFASLPLWVESKKLCCYKVTMLRWKKTTHCNCQLNTSVFRLPTFFTFPNLQIRTFTNLKLCLFTSSNQKL